MPDEQKTHSRDYLERTIETVRVHRDADDLEGPHRLARALQLLRRMGRASLRRSPRQVASMELYSSRSAEQDRPPTLEVAQAGTAVPYDSGASVTPASYLHSVRLLPWWLVVLLLGAGIIVGHYVVPHHEDRPCLAPCERGDVGVDWGGSPPPTELPSDIP